MRKLTCFVLLFVVMTVSVATFTGCEKPTTDQKVAGLRAAAEIGASIGLNTWAKDHKADAVEAATALRKNAREVLLPYLNNEAALPTSTEVQAFISSSLFKGVDPTIKSALQGASVVLDLSMPVPSSDKLNKDAIKYLKAFLEGAASGCDSFLEGAGSRELKKPPAWLK